MKWYQVGPKTVSSSSKNPIEDETDDKYNQTELKIESTHNQTLVETKTNPSGSTQHNPLQIQDSFNPKIFNDYKQNTYLDLQEEFPELFLIQQNQAVIERSKLQQQKKPKLLVKYDKNNHWNVIYRYNS